MEERHGARGTVHEGVFFTESSLAAGERLGSVSVKIGKQNANLGQVKTKMAEQAKARGATAIAEFRYGQRKHGPIQLINPFRWDTEHWYGEGIAIRI